MLDVEHLRELGRFATRIRVEALKSIAAVGIGHIGGTLSVCDVLAVLYGGVMRVDPSNPRWEGRDYLVLSKGHSGPALYAALALKGFFSVDLLKTLNQPGTTLPSHCDRLRTPGVDMTTGSLGQGASSAAGIALGLKRRAMSNHVYLILGDGECNEGQVWEMALFAHQFKLDNLTAFVDYNKQQIDGFTYEVCDLGDLAAKFAAFGWHAQAVDGHDVGAMIQAIEVARTQAGRPSMVVLNTIKGKGVSWWEGDRNNHNIPITAEQLERALQELGATVATS
jgi:transketolase